MRKHTRAALTAAPLSLALLLAACGSDDDDSADTTTTTTTTTTEAASPSSSADTSAPPDTAETTAPATETTAPPSQAGDPLPEGGTPWAEELIRAWGAGDRERAAELATPAALDALFGAHETGGTDWDLLSCDSTAGSQICTFTSAEKAESVMTTYAGDTITSASVGTADPDGVPPELADAADALIQAWGAGDRDEASRYTSPADLGTLFGVADPGGTTWERTMCVAIDDDPQCAYRSPDHDVTVILHVSEGTASPVSYIYAYLPS